MWETSKPVENFDDLIWANLTTIAGKRNLKRYEEMPQRMAVLQLPLYVTIKEET